MKKNNYRHYTDSSSFKMALLFTILLGLSVSILGFFIYSFSKETLISETDTSIQAEINSLIEWHRLSSHADMLKVLEERILTGQEFLYHYFDEDENKILGNMDKLPKDAHPLTEGLIQFQLQNKTYAGKIHTFKDQTYLLVSRNIQDLLILHQRFHILSACMIGLMLVVIVVSFVISTFVVRLTNDIARTAHDIMETGDLSRRVDITTRWDDLSNLAFVLNTLLDRIEELMYRIRDVSDSIAHDLRTPLTHLRNRLEGLQNRSNNLASFEQELENLTIDADDLLNTFSAMLRISNIEKGKRHTEFRDFSLSDVARDAVELYAPIAEDKNISIQLTQTGEDGKSYKGDRDLIFQAIANLIDNAVKFTPDNGSIHINVSFEDGKHKLSFLNTGDGVLAQEIDRLFDRFFRGDKSRTTSGSGLGLSLVKAVAELHKGTVKAQNIDDGFSVTILL